MLGSITPLGERSRGRRWGLTVAWFFAGAVGAGALLGAGLGSFGQLVLVSWIGAGWDLRTALFALVACVAVLFDTRLLPWELPGPRRQVNENWLYTYRGWFYGVGFGAQLGAAVTTFVTTAAVYLALTGAFLLATPAGGAAVGAMFGLTRGLTLLPGGRVRTTAALGRQAARVDDWDAPSLTVTVAIEAAAALVAALMVLV
jgi:hypothetical protein